MTWLSPVHNVSLQGQFEKLMPTMSHTTWTEKALF
jgi:hypothetical protein